MSRTYTTEQHEQRNDKLIDLTRQQHAVIAANLKARAPHTKKLIFDALANYVADDAALEELMLGTVDGANALQSVINNLIWTEAESMAEAEVARLEREGRAADEEARRDRATWERQFA